MAKKASPSLPLYRNIAVSFSALTLLLVGTILYFSLSRATIVITPAVQAFPLTTAVTVTTAAEQNTRTLSGKILNEEVKREDTFPTSVVREEDAKASGTVRIVNNTGNAQTLVATTRFLTPGKILFRLKDTVVVPARGGVAGTIVADAPGAAGEVAATRFTIPGLNAQLQDKIYGESSVPMAGGRRTIARVTQQDVDTARATLLSRIEQEIRAREEGADDASDPVVTLLTVEPVTSALREKLGAETKTLTLGVTARVRGVVVSEKALQEWIMAYAKTTLPDDQKLLPLPLTSLTTTISELDAEKGTARLVMKGEGQAVLRGTSPTFERARFVGRTPVEVERLLRENGGIAAVKVTLSPFFVKRLPRLPDHIRVEIRE